MAVRGDGADHLSSGFNRASCARGGLRAFMFRRGVKDGEGKRMGRFVACAASIGVILIAGSALAGPKETCAQIVQHLGYPTDDYAFKEAGVFARAQHIFGSLTCYVEYDGAFNSLYRGDTPVAEDGYFGLEAIARKEEAERKAESAIAAAKRERDAAVDSARKKYDDATSRVHRELDTQLEEIKKASDPFRSPTVTPQDTEGSIRSSEPEGGGGPNIEKPAAAPSKPEVDSTTGSTDVTSEPAQDGPEESDDANSSATKLMWVTVSRLNIRSCPSSSCGQTGWITDGNKVTVYEEKEGWSRISEATPAMCGGGISDAIDTGNRKCDAANGIVDGKLFRWVASKYLSDKKPEEVKTPATCKGDYLRDSDNYRLYAKQFCTAAEQLIAKGWCTQRDLSEWTWSLSTTKGDGIYFTWCGQGRSMKRYYLDVRTGRIFQ